MAAVFLNEALGSIGRTDCVQARTNVRRGLEIGERPRGSGQLPCGGAQEDNANGKPFNSGFTPVDWRTPAMRFAGPHIRDGHQQARAYPREYCRQDPAQTESVFHLVHR